ncbi:hypothetical protein ACN47E_002582 [Coniothyrium glycines]
MAGQTQLLCFNSGGVWFEETISISRRIHLASMRRPSLPIRVKQKGHGRSNSEPTREIEGGISSNNKSVKRVAPTDRNALPWSLCSRAGKREAQKDSTPSTPLQGYSTQRQNENAVV